MQSLNLGSVEDFPFLEAPPKRAIADGYQLLNELGATDGQNALTTIGRELARLPLDPRIGRMILEARHREALREVLIVASALSVQDVRDRPLELQQAADQAHAKFDDEKSEFLGTLKLWSWLEHSRGGHGEHRLSSAQARAAAARQLHLAAPRARVARHPRAAAVGRHRARLARQRERADLRAAAPVDARRPARQHRRQERRGRVVPRRARHPLLAPSRARACRRSRGAGSSPPSWSRRRGSMRAASPRSTRAGCRSSRATSSRRSCSSRTGRRRRRRWSRSSARRSTASSSTPTSGSTSRTVDPAAAREIFIREALVAGEWETKLPFAAANRKLIAQVEELEHKSRRQDVLVDDELIFAFYDQQLPADVHSGADLRALVPRRGQAPAQAARC